MRVLFLTNIPSPYRVDFFNELGKYCELTVLFEKSFSNERDNSWKEYRFDNFQGIILSGVSIKTDMAFCLGVLKYLNDKSYDKIICTNFLTPTGMLAVWYMKKKHITYYLESDGGFAKTGKGVKEWLKRQIISKANGYFSTSKECDKYYIAYGAEVEKIHRYSFSSVNESDILQKPVSKMLKRDIRKQLNISEGKVLLTVGQFIYRKGFDILIEAASKMNADIGIYFVGGIPTNQYLDMKEKYNLTNVHFVGFKAKDELREYYCAADLFVLPTREDIWGLVVNEAMAYGLPIITTERCIAGLEMVRQGVNGYICKVHNVEEMTEKILDILGNDHLQTKMSMMNLKQAHKYSIENMVMDHVKVLDL